MIPVSKYRSSTNVYMNQNMRIIVVLSVLFGSLFATKECSTGENCEIKCMTNCSNCSRDNVCEQCEPGYFLNNHICYKCPSNCISCSSLDKCGICKDGFYNERRYDVSRPPLRTNCSLRCREECSSCISYKYCNNCTDGGHLCHCKTRNESSKICASCYRRNYGNYCNRSCSVGCKNHLCDFNAGTCECIHNFQGDYCDRCIDGKYGRKCEKQCERCYPGTACEKHSGVCDECVEGFYSRTCDLPCSANCKSCKKNYGHHCITCKPGKYGKKTEENGKEYIACHNDCSDHCLNKTCTRDSGNCYTGCVKGHWGVRCGSTCSVYCKDSECFQGNGSCLCCREGQYGSYCDKPCQVGCKENICTRDGNCKKCKKGFTGSKCETCEECISVVTIIIPATSSLFVIAVVIIISIVVIRR
ncbi:multiple epidermal growth factor-like domains protein 10 [Ruditapes philippinarum]|uniref:multiple epidermal growth factor-like domains protein 10 n=1 Tax=Ruditapes philippinarum TaxID=129788 RepID=UPI00295ABF23|nr:multiple epidermal growth factor-like domains protein 10 [Ruditapes philippinarum]